MTLMANALAVERASLRYGTFQALIDVTFSVGEGQLVTLLGPSGCGKTTLLKAIAGFMPLDSGRIEISGRDMQGVPPEKRDTAMCFQSYALFPHLSVAENIAFGLRQRRIKSSDIASRVAAVAQQVGLSPQLEKLPGQLSGGQQQRVALARAMAVHPGVMLFDEPLSNLDLKLRDHVRIEIRALQREHGFTAVYVTHDQQEALAMSDLVIVMRNGMIEQMGPPEQIYRHPVNRFVADFVGTANIMPVDVLASDQKSGRYEVTCPFGKAIIHSATPPVGSRIYACWRPEDAMLTSEITEEENRFTFDISARTFLGSLCNLALSPRNGAAEAFFRIQTHGFTPVREGQTVDVVIPPDAIRFLEEVVA
ncbi:ABC transporter ATP-binding protein [Rhizobium lemnae]|uniref:ABC transporter ATP-binding protein n=1 Tax=Rhizobium lemnae TaxID=1214924 RepID=A0ABV8EF05_9HYPH|nr:ABC transporter ATP-binding protein [Rhizobium lemnae]MCJ8510245.1 ABC transporter ATP-binding protein [Rhizobium lemnae]